MVHALRRARRYVKRNGHVILVQPHQQRRPDVAIATRTSRQPVAALINPVFQPLIDNAVASIRTVVDERRFTPVSTSNHQFRVQLPNTHQMDAYFRGGIRPPRFPPGGRRRLHEMWKARAEGAQIEITEHMTLIVMKAGPAD